MKNKLTHNTFSLNDSTSTLSLLSKDSSAFGVASNLVSVSARASFNLLMEALPNLVSFYFIGKYSSGEVQSIFGIVFAVTICLGYGVFDGLAYGLEKLLASAQPGLMIVIYQRTLVISTLAMLPVIGVLWISAQLLSLVVKESMPIAQTMILFCAVSIYFQGLYKVSKSYINTKQSSECQTKSILVSNLTHILTCVFFVEYCEFTVYGVLLAKTVTDIFNLNLFFRLVNMNNQIKLEVFQSIRWSQITPLTRKLMEKGWGRSLRTLAYWAFALHTINSQHSQITAFIIAICVYNFLCQIMRGFGETSTSQVSRSLLNSRKTSALYAKFCALSLSIVAIICCLLLVFSKWPELFTTEMGVIQLLLGATPFLVLLLLVDCLHVFVSMVSNAVGEHRTSDRHYLFFFLGLGHVACILQRLVRPEHNVNNILLSMSLSTLIYVIWQGRILLSMDFRIAARNMWEQMEDQESSLDGFLQVYFPEFIRQVSTKSCNSTQMGILQTVRYSI